MLYSLWKICGMLLHFWMGLSWCSHFGKLALTWRVELKLTEELIMRYIHKGSVLVLCVHLCVRVQGRERFDDRRGEVARRQILQWCTLKVEAAATTQGIHRVTGAGEGRETHSPFRAHRKEDPANTSTRALQKRRHSLTSRSLKELRRVILRY